MSSPYLISYRGTFDLDHPPAAIWARLIDVASYASGWRWISNLEVHPTPLEPGAQLSFVATAPIPYRVHIELEIQRMVIGRSIHARVRRDLDGTGSIELAPHGAGTRATLSWEVEMQRRSLKIAARTARPVLLLGHDWAVRAAIASFRRGLTPETDNGQ